MGEGKGRLGRLMVFVTCCTTVSFAPSARADSTHYQTLQLGDRSRGMAAAYTAFAADGAAIWFNPAGLPLLEARLLQGSLPLVQKRTLEIEDALVTDGPDGPGREDQVEDFEVQSSPTLPGFAVASFAVGSQRNKAAKERAIEAQRALDEARKRAKEAEEEIRELERQKGVEELDEDDQRGIQGTTTTGIETIR